jgi:hypothetical protein
MPAGQLPPDGDLRIGAVTLPAGRRVTPFAARRPVAWITRQPVLDIPRAWAMLSDAHEQTGLVPVSVIGGHAQGTRPWEAGELYPLPVCDLDGLDAADVLAASWDSRIPGEEEDDAEAAGERAPFSRRFPGLAPRQDQELAAAERGRAIGSLKAAYLALVPAARPADVVPLIGWVPANWTEGTLPVGAVLRSREDRFGAQLVEIGSDEIRLLADRPPRTLQAAQAIAAEHFAFADECGGKGLSTVSRIAADLISNPFWSFWWD